MFQLLTVTPPYLVCIATVTLLNYPSRPTCFYCLSLSFFCLLLLPTDPPSIAVHHQIPISFAPAPHLLSRRKAPPTWTSPVPTSLCRLSIRPATRAYICLCSCDCDPPPFSALGLLPGLCWPLGVCLSRVPPLLCDPAFPSPSSPPNPCIVRSLVSFRVDFCGRVRGQDASTP